MDQEIIIQKTIDFVKESLADAQSDHDWWHVYRVWKLSKHIAQTEKVDIFIVELGALLHDIADAKFYDGDEKIGPQKARDFLSSLDVEEEIIIHIENIILHISFKGEKHIHEFDSPELDVIQDADRLDAMGAIGIARLFNYGGSKNRMLYDPNNKAKLNMSKKEYSNESINCKSTSVNHFYEKLLLLKDKMNTNTGKSMAEHRHTYMEQFLDEFYKEWNGS
jgi:uncharacterized protein